MIPLDKHDLTLLHIMVDKDLLLQAVKLVKKGTDLFPAKLRPHLALIWRVLVKQLVLSKKENRWLQFNKQLLVADCLEEMKTFDMLDENKAKLQHICEEYLQTESINSEEGRTLLKGELEECLQRQLSQAIYNSSSFESIRNIVETGKDLRENIVASESKNLFVNPLMNAEQYLKKIPKLPMGVKYFDKATHGGMAEKEVAFIAGLTGGGKSTITVECTGAQLLQNRYVAWFTYEQSFDQDLMQRMVAYISGYDLSKVRGSSFDELPENVQQTFNKVREKTASNLMAADFTSDVHLDKNDPDDDGSAYSIKKRLQLWYDQGKVPHYVFVDWLGAAVRIIASRRGIDIGKITNYIAIANDFIMDLVEIAKKFKTRIVFFHQLDPAIKKSPPSRKPTSVELQFIKSVGNYVYYAMVLGKRDSNERCWFICDKCRTGPPSEYVVELKGEQARFELLQGFSPGRDGQFIDIAAIQEEMEDNEVTDLYDTLI